MSTFGNGFARGFVEGLEGPSSPEASVMMDLGGLRFGISSQEYESLQTTMSWKWAAKARYGREEALQYQGKAAVTKTFAFKVIVERSKDLEFTGFLERMGDEGKPHRLIAGHSLPVGGVMMVSGGADMGLWCITDLSVNESEFMRDGTSMLKDISLTIKKYGEDMA